jgi:hypothetical protein
MGLAPPPARREELAQFSRHLRERTTPETVSLTVNGDLQSVPTSHPDLRLTQLVPADATTRAALASAGITTRPATRASSHVAAHSVRDH